MIGTLLLAIGKALWPLVRPLVGPLLAYFKGRADAKRDEELKTRRREDALIDKARDAGRDAAGSDKLHDRHFRD